MHVFILCDMFIFCALVTTSRLEEKKALIKTFGVTWSYSLYCLQSKELHCYPLYYYYTIYCAIGNVYIFFCLSFSTTKTITFLTIVNNNYFLSLRKRLWQGKTPWHDRKNPSEEPDSKSKPILFWVITL